MCWPISAYLDVTHGWRTTCYVWAVAHLVLGLPLNTFLPAGKHHKAAGPQAEGVFVTCFGVSRGGREGNEATSGREEAGLGNDSRLASEQGQPLLSRFTSELKEPSWAAYESIAKFVAPG